MNMSWIVPVLFGALALYMLFGRGATINGEEARHLVAAGGHLVDVR